MAADRFRAFAHAPVAALNPECISCTPPQHDPDTVFFTDHWKVVLHPSQCGLGNVLLASRRHVPRMADLTPAEWQDFQTVITALEPALEHAFGAALVNMAYGRNWAYREAEPDPPFKDGQPNPTHTSTGTSRRVMPSPLTSAAWSLTIQHSGSRLNVAKSLCLPKCAAPSLSGCGQKSA